MRRLILVGGGHVHVEVLRAAARRPLAGVELLLVSPRGAHVYSSMMPWQLREDLPEAAVALDLRALCAAAGARFVEAAAERLEGGARPVVHAAGTPLECDLLSLDVGAVPAGLDTPGARDHALAVRPLARWRALLAHVRALAARDASGAPGAPRRVVVVGGGAAGVELALAAHDRLTGAGGAAAVTLVERGDALLAGMGARLGARAAAILRARGVRLLLGRGVARVDADAVRLDDGERLPSDATVWATGAAAPPLLAGAGLPLDDDGFLLVDDTLRAVDGAPVWGAGDCVTLRDAPWVAKAGVYAVREAPVLAWNLRAAAGGAEAPRRYTPQRHFLSLLDTADGRALLGWHGLTAHAGWTLRLKRAIDRRYVARYRGAGVRG